MQTRVTLKKVIIIVKLSLFVIWFWPLTQNTTKHKILYMKLYQYVSLLLAVAALASMLYSLIKNLDDTNLAIKSALGLFPCSHLIWNILCHLITYRRLQHVTSKMEHFCATIKPNEEIIVQKEYIDKYASFYGFCISSFYMGIFALLLGPCVLDEPLPAPADFPFDASHQPMRSITYIHQIMVGLQMAAQLSANAFMALLLWLVSAKFKLLTEELRSTTNIYDFMRYIKKHQQLLEYAMEVTVAIRPFALGTVVCSTVSLIIFGLILIAGVPLSLKIQCVFLAFNALLEVFMYAWPAEHLVYISNNIAHTVFDTDWYNKSVDLRRNLQMIILRSQKPIVVALPCGLPSLSLRYYASYLSTIFSYFTTVRIMFDEK